MTVAIVLRNEAEDAARHEHSMFVSFTAQASVQTNPQGRARLLRLAAEARSNALSWARLSNWLQLRVTLGLTFLLVLVGCEVEPYVDFEPEPEPVDCEAEVVLDFEAIIPDDAWLDGWRCPQEDPDPEAPFDGGCGYAYMTAVEQPDGQIWGVCERRLDCECLANWRACSTETPEDPWYCSCLIVHAGSIDDVLECEEAR